MLADVPALTRERMLVNRTQWYDERYAFGFARARHRDREVHDHGERVGPGL